MTVMTVMGPVDTDTLGITLPHEHIFIDIRNQFADLSDPEKARVGRQKVSPKNVDTLRRNPCAIKDNLCLDDMEVAVEEVGCFKALGETTIVDCTSVGIGRDGRKLREVASLTGLNIIAGCGYYTFDPHPPEMFDWSVDRVAEQLIADLTVGMDGRDTARVKVIKQLLKLGFAGQILVANDICLKSMLRYYGRWGYDHILRHVAPMLREEGIGGENVDTLLGENPRRLLAL